MMGLLFKLRNRASAASKAEVEQTLARLKVAAHPMFPDAQGDLARIYSADVPARREAKVRAELEQIRGVEYVESAPKRKLMVS